jgi:type III pantothenate kinase
MNPNCDPDFLVIDISNSFTKYARVSAGQLGKVHTTPTPQLDENWVRTLQREQPETPVALSSVVPRQTKYFREIFHTNIAVLSGKNAEPLEIAYPRKNEIGADRLANALALRELYGAPGVVLDFGTAVTFDVINDAGAYCGGAIAPGLNAMTDYLHERTALLPRVKIKEPINVIAQSTIEAIRVGALVGYRGLIRAILAGVSEELNHPKKLRVVATGGQAHIVVNGMREVEAIHPHLTLEGLRLWFQHRLARSKRTR